jgi:acyl-CoA synthetase (AMP-forming)/AMP-acid ligase II
MLLFGAARRFQGNNPPNQRWGVVKPLGLLNLMISGPVQTINSGCPLVVVDRVDPVGLAEWLEGFAIDLIHIAPPTLRDLLAHPDVRPEQLAGTQLWVGGASCPESLVAMYRERFGRDPDQGYGLTEAPCGVTTTYGWPDAPATSVGKALPHVRISIRDEDGNELAADHTGEVCVGAVADGPWAGVYTPMLRYWGQPEATEVALAGGVLHTGDVGRLDADGFLYIVDRKSEMIVRGGYNVYPAEVERVICLVPSVGDCVVVPRADERMGEVPVAVLEPLDGMHVEPEDVIEACRTQLARYKVPADVVVVDELPRTAMQKVNRAVARTLAADHSPERIHDVR